MEYNIIKLYEGNEKISFGNLFINIYNGIVDIIKNH